MRVVYVLICLALSGSVFADDLVFPETIGDFQRADFMDFERETPGAGYGQNYRAPKALATVYVYTRGLTVPDSADDEFFAQELARTRSEFQAIAAQRQYAGVRIGEYGRFVDIGGDRCLSMLAGYTLGASTHITMTCVMPFDRKILKVRYTFETADTAAQGAQLRAFLTALGELLGTRKPASPTE